MLNSLSLSEIIAYDSGVIRGSKSRHCCPRCAKTVGPAHRDLSVARDSGLYHCFACGVRGRLADKAYRPLYHTIEKRIPGFIDFSHVGASLKNYEQNAFATFLINEFGAEKATKALARFLIGTRNTATIFWQIDERGKVRTGKVIEYEPYTGKRRRDVAPNWIHSIMQRLSLPKDDDYGEIIGAQPYGSLPTNFCLSQCFFGQHQLHDSPKSRPVAIVESEKSAVIASIGLPRFTWLASGGKDMLRLNRIEFLRGRIVLLYPDIDGHAQWTELAERARFSGIDCRVFDLIATHSSDAERSAKIDIADWLIACQRHQTKSPTKSARTDLGIGSHTYRSGANVESAPDLSEPEWSAENQSINIHFLGHSLSVPQELPPSNWVCPF